MKLSGQKLQEYFFGAINFKEIDGYSVFYHYPDEVISYFKNVSEFWFDRAKYQSSCTIECITDATKLSLSYKMVNFSSLDTFDLYVNGKEYKVVQLCDIPETGVVDFDLPVGNKHIALFFPLDAEIWVEYADVNGKVEKVAKGEKVLWFGDSITQGYGTCRTGETYVNITARALNYNVVNLGIGGYIYDKNNVFKTDNFTPDKIIVAMGTNHYKATDFKQAVSDFYKRLNEVYGDIPVLCITPLWRSEEHKYYERFNKSQQEIKEVVSAYKNVTLLSGLDLVPHLLENYIDGLHPNVKGARLYSENLVKFILNKGF